MNNKNGNKLIDWKLLGFNAAPSAASNDIGTFLSLIDNVNQGKVVDVRTYEPYTTLETKNDGIGTIELKRTLAAVTATVTPEGHRIQMTKVIPSTGTKVYAYASNKYLTTEGKLINPDDKKIIFWLPFGDRIMVDHNAKFDALRQWFKVAKDILLTSITESVETDPNSDDYKYTLIKMGDIPALIEWYRDHKKISLKGVNMIQIKRDIALANFARSNMATLLIVTDQLLAGRKESNMYDTSMFDPAIADVPKQEVVTRRETETAYIHGMPRQRVDYIKNGLDSSPLGSFGGKSYEQEVKAK